MTLHIPPNPTERQDLLAKCPRCHRLAEATSVLYAKRFRATGHECPCGHGFIHLAPPSKEKP